MVTKRKRRAQLARASAQRRSSRMAARETRRRRLQLSAALLAALAAVVALVVWILVHEDDAGVRAATPSSTMNASVPSTTLIEVAA